MSLGIIVLIFIWQISFSQAVNCPSGFEQLDDLNICLKLLTSTRLNWFRSVNQCRNENQSAFLAEIKTEEQQRKVKKWLQAKDIRQDVWTGLTDLNSYGAFQWSHSGECVKEANWLDNHPNDKIESPSCVVMDKDYKSGFRWRNYYCLDYEALPLCQIIPEESLDNKCPNLITTPSKRVYPKLMVVGGSPNMKKVEVIELCEKENCCSRVLENAPFNGGAVGVYINGHTMVCAGSNKRDECYIHDRKENIWTKSNSLNLNYYDRGSVRLNQDEWIVTGGYDDDSHDEIEIFSKKTNLFSLSSLKLPKKTSKHVLLALDENSFLSLGGEASNEVNIHRRTSGTDDEWTTEKLARNIPRYRYYPQAGLVTFPDGKRKLVVAGDNYAELSTDIYDFESETWSDGPELPFSVSQGASVPFKDTFLIVGGTTLSGDEGEDSIHYDTILEFDPVNNMWIKRKEHMTYENTAVAALLVPDDYITCH